MLLIYNISNYDLYILKDIDLYIISKLLIRYNVCCVICVYFCYCIDNLYKDGYVLLYVLVNWVKCYKEFYFNVLKFYLN